MSTLVHRAIRYIVVPVAFVLGVAGCGAGNNGLPDEVTIELPDGSTVSADKGSGAEALANTRWSFVRSADNAQGARFVTVQFNEDGNLERFDDNTIASGIFGDSIQFDGDRHDTLQPGLTYGAATYGAQTNDATGFSFAARFTAFAAGLQAAHGEATATGTFDPDDPTVLRGTFYFKTEVTLIDYPEGNQEDTITFVARLETE